jgi:hypothetical protein
MNIKNELNQSIPVKLILPWRIYESAERKEKKEKKENNNNNNKNNNKKRSKNKKSPKLCLGDLITGPD